MEPRRIGLRRQRFFFLLLLLEINIILAQRPKTTDLSSKRTGSSAAADVLFAPAPVGYAHAGYGEKGLVYEASVSKTYMMQIIHIMYCILLLIDGGPYAIIRIHAQSTTLLWLLEGGRTEG